MEDNFRRVPPPPPPRPNIPPRPEAAPAESQMQARPEATMPSASVPAATTTSAQPEQKAKKGLSPTLALTLKIAGAIVSLGLAVFFLYMLIS